jgi:transglutaminase-like putative cysteine protease
MAFPLKSVLNAVVSLIAVLSFFMGRELVGVGYTWGFLALMLAAWSIERLGLPHPPRFLINLAALAALGGIFGRARYNYVVESLMESLLLMIAIKMLEDRKPRDYVQVVVLGLGMVVCYAMLSAEKDFIVYCFGTGLVATLALLLSTWYEKEPRAVLTARELRQLFGRAGALFAAMLPLCLALFFGLPRATTPIFGMRSQFGSSSTGFSDQVRLGDVAAIQSSSKLAFRAEMVKLEPQTPYWRGVVLDIFDGRTWIASRNSRGVFIPDTSVPRIEQEISLEAGNQGRLFALDQPLAVIGVDVIADGAGVFRHRSSTMGRRVQYRAISILSPRMSPSPEDIEPDKRRCLRLPANFMPRLQTLTAGITVGLNDREKIDAIMKFFSEFSYSMEGLPNTWDALDRFIFVDKQGNCEYFAAAMAVMLRMAGVPARMVGGYRGGFYNEAGNYYIVQEQNAHVWVEAWNEASGAWVRHDPTPLGQGAGSGLSAYDTLALYLDLLDHQWSKLIVTYNWETQAEILRNLREIIRNPQASLTPTRDGLLRLGGALSVPVAVLGALVACGAFFYLICYLRGRRLEITLLAEFSRVMGQRGYRRLESEGLSEFLTHVADPHLRALALPFVRAFEEHYYGDRPLNAEVLRHALRKIRGFASYSGLRNHVRK